MSDPSSLTLAGSLAEIRDRLIEAKRYVLSDPDGCRRMLDSAWSDLIRLADGPECRATVYPDGMRVCLGDCAVDLVCAAGCLLAAPDVAAAYLTTVAYELGGLRGMLETKAGAAARDAEPAEAYGKEKR